MATATTKPTSSRSVWRMINHAAPALSVLALLVTLGIVSRFVLADIPNFKPVAAIALFAAFYFQRFWISAIAVLSVMLVSNFGLAGCPWQVTCGVVGGLLVASWLGRRVAKSDEKFSWRLSGRLAGASLTMSVAFFVISNASVWLTGQWYPLTLTGLIECYSVAVPFFRFTLTSDLMFTGGLFGVHFVCVAVADKLAAKSDDVVIAS